MSIFSYNGHLLRGNRTLNMGITQSYSLWLRPSSIMADITINGISCSHQSIATAGWRGPNPFKRWFGSILPALAKHCGSRCGRNCLNGGTHLHCCKTEYHWQTSEAEVMLRYYWAVKHIIRLCLTHSSTSILWVSKLHIYHCTSRTRYIPSALPNFFLCCLAGSRFILLAIFLSFMLPPPREWEKLFLEKRIIIICGSALESNVPKSWSNYRLWQMDPAVSFPPLRSLRRPIDKCKGIPTSRDAGSLCCSTRGCQVPTFI